MRLPIRSFFVAAAIAMGGAAAQSPCSDATGWTPRTAFESDVDFTADPIAQIQSHLASVVADLRDADVAHLAVSARATRSKLIAELAEYAAAGVFPQNNLRDYPTPVFIDDDGRACAVGHLMLVSDGAETALRVADEQNTAYIPDITIPGVLAWMERSGLTPLECAHIQPTYGPCGLFPGAPFTIPVCSSTVPTNGPFGVPARLEICGSGEVARNDLTLHATFLPQDAVGVFLVSQSRAYVPMAYGGRRTLCLGGDVRRLSGAPFSASSHGCGGWCSYVGSATVDLTSMPTSAGSIAVQPGETWIFQAWFRESNPSPDQQLHGRCGDQLLLISWATGVRYHATYLREARCHDRLPRTGGDHSIGYAVRSVERPLGIELVIANNTSPIANTAT